MNSKSKSVFTWIIVVVISAIFVLTGTSFMFGGMSFATNTVVQVGSNKISKQQYEQMVLNTSKSYKISEEQAHAQILPKIINDALLAQGNDKLNLNVSTLELQGAIFNDPTFQEDGEFSQDKLSQFAVQYGGINNLEYLVKSNILQNTVPMNLQQSSFATETEIKNMSKIINQTKDITLYTLKTSDFAKDVKVSTKDVENYYNEHKTKYSVAPQVKIEYYKVAADDFDKDIKISDDEIQAYYDNNLNLFTAKDGKTQTLAESKDTIIQIIKSEDAIELMKKELSDVNKVKFTSIAKDHSLKTSKETIEQDKDTTILSDTVSSSMFFTDISDYGVISLDNKSMVVYKVLSRDHATTKPLVSVKADIKKTLKNQQATEILNIESKALLQDLINGKKVSYKAVNTNINRESKDYSYSLIADVLTAVNEGYQESDQGDIVYIYKVNKVLEPKEEVSEITVENIYTVLEQEAYIDLLRAEYPVKINQEMFL